MYCIEAERVHASDDLQIFNEELDPTEWYG